MIASDGDSVGCDLVFPDLNLDEIDIEFARAPIYPPRSDLDPDRSLLGSLVYKPGLWKRNKVRFVTVRRWRTRNKTADLHAFTDAKRHMDEALIETAASEIGGVLNALLGPPQDHIITNVACGHSRRPDCFGTRLAQYVAALVGAPYLRVFADRFVGGSSHPKEAVRLPPLRRVAVPGRMCVVVDDVATSGWHLEEALDTLRRDGIVAFGIAWLGGMTQ